MINKRIIIIVILAVIIFFASAILVFFLVKRSGGKVAVNKYNSSITDELIKNNPGLTSAQLKLYSDTAVKGNITTCLGKTDESACISSVAYIIGDPVFCHDVSDGKLYQICIAGALKRTASVKVSQCEPLSGDDYYYCLGLIFAINDAELDCAVLPDPGTRTVCEDFFNYQAAYSKYDRKLCQTIKTEKINQYCLKNIIDKN